MRTRDEVDGSRTQERTDGGVVVPRFVFMSCFFSLPDHALLASYRLGSSVRVVRYGRLDSPVRVVRYGRVLRSIKEIVVK